MTLLYPNLCYNEVCYKGTALYCYYFPVKATRVRLQKRPGMDDSDYINANYVKVPYIT